MLLERQFISAQDFLEIVNLPEYLDRNVELVEGEIADMPLPNPVHAAVLGNLASEIGVHVKRLASGNLLVGDAPFILERRPDGKDTLRGIDIAFLSFNRFPGPLPSEPLQIAPDLAVEIISPGNKAADIRQKIHQLLAAGTSIVWVVYPETRIVDVHTREGLATLESGDILSGGDVLPGFEIPVSEIFPA